MSETFDRRGRDPVASRAAALGVALVIGVLLAAAPPERRLVPPVPELITLEFKGGTAAQYIDAVRHAAANLNVMAAAEAAEVPVTAVTLRRVSAAAALELLSGRVVRSPQRIVELSVRQLPTHVPDEDPTFQVVAEVQVRGNEPDSGSRVWSAQRLLDAQIPSQAVLSAVELALEVAGAADGIDVRFHQDTGLLIARGRPQDLAVVDGVISGLRQSVEERAARVGSPRSLQARITELERMLQEKEAELATLRLMLDAPDVPERNDG